MRGGREWGTRKREREMVGWGTDKTRQLGMYSSVDRGRRYTEGGGLASYKVNNI